MATTIILVHGQNQQGKDRGWLEQGTAGMAKDLSQVPGRKIA